MPSQNGISLLSQNKTHNVPGQQGQPMMCWWHSSIQNVLKNNYCIRKFKMPWNFIANISKNLNRDFPKFNKNPNYYMTLPMSSETNTFVSYYERNKCWSITIEERLNSLSILSIEYSTKPLSYEEYDQRFYSQKKEKENQELKSTREVS